jgi:hypothetical protein
MGGQRKLGRQVMDVDIKSPGGKYFVGMTVVSAFGFVVALISMMIGHPTHPFGPIASIFVLLGIAGFAVIQVFPSNWITTFCARHSPSCELIVNYCSYAVICVFISILACYSGKNLHVWYLLPPSLALGAIPIIEAPLHRPLTVILNGVIYLVVRLLFKHVFADTASVDPELFVSYLIVALGTQSIYISKSIIYIGNKIGEQCKRL